MTESMSQCEETELQKVILMCKFYKIQDHVDTLLEALEKIISK